MYEKYENALVPRREQGDTQDGGLFNIPNQYSCRRRRKILRILCICDAGGKDWATFYVFLRHQIWADLKKLQAYIFLRLQQFSAEPPPHRPLGTQVLPYFDRKVLELSTIL